MHLSACLPFVRSTERNRIIAFDKLRKEEHVHSRYLFGNRMGALERRRSFIRQCQELLRTLVIIQTYLPYLLYRRIIFFLLLFNKPMRE